MAVSDTEWTSRLTENISKTVLEMFGAGASLVSLQPERIDRRYSFVFRYQVKTQEGIRRILVKIPHESWMQSMDEAITSEHIRDVVSKEFNVMTFIANIIETSDAPGLFAIRPGAWLSEFGALVLEEYSLHMLKNDLHRLSFILNVQKTLGNFEKQAELTGVWLRVIHKNTNHGQTQYFDSLNIIENLHKEIAFLEKLSGSSLDYLGRKFRALSKSLENYDVPFAALHNDFHLGNIFVLDDGRVGALDPNWVESGTVYKDLSSLLIDPLTRKMQVASAGLLFRRHMYDRFEKAVLRGYFGDSKVPMSMICFYCAVNVIEKWRMDEELLSAGRTKVQSFIFRLGKPAVRYYFRKLILTYLDRGIASLNGSTND